MQRLLFLVLLFTAPVSAVNAAATQPDFQQLYAYALLSDAAYRPGDAVKQSLASTEYSVTGSGELPGYGVSWFIATSDEQQRHIVVVRGTTNIENVIVDVAFQFDDDAHTGIKLHQGFARSASYLYDKIKPELQRGYRIDTTGHSLGGAVALILAMHLDKDGFDVGKVVTFGQPKVSNVGGSKKYGHLDVTRVVTEKDMVPLVPPIDPMSIMQLNIYWHQGIEVLLLDGNEYALLEGMDSILRAANVLVDMPGEKHLRHHMMAEYIDGIRRRQAAAQQVEYKTGGIRALW